MSNVRAESDPTVTTVPGAPSVPTSHPRALWFFFWGEFAERCSYYGMRAILPLYLAAGLHFPDTKASSIYYWFKMACYFLPLLGGWLADRFFGRYWTIVGFSVPYVLGHFILGMGTETSLLIALALLAGGSGVIKPNISTLMGQTYDQQRPGQEQLRAAAFLWFYFSINVGALLSILVVPILRNHYGYARAFQFPAWVMVGSLLVFALGKPFYAKETRAPRTPLSPEERRQRWRTLRQLFGVFGLFVFFWVAYEHNDSIWVYFARDYVNLKLPFVGKAIAPDQPQFVNPLCVLLLVPLFNWAFHRWDPAGRVTTPHRKIFVGFLFSAAAPACMTLAALDAHHSGGRVSLGWLVAAYVLLTVGEVLLYGTALELAYAVAPKSMKGFITACFLLTDTLGNFVNVWFAPLYGGSLTDPASQRGPLSPTAFFTITTAIVLAAALGFLFIGRGIGRQETPGR